MTVSATAKWVVWFSLVAASCGQDRPLPLLSGVTLPVRLGRTLRAGRNRVGETVAVKTTQRVPVGEGVSLGSGESISGTVVASAVRAEGAVLGIRFDGITVRGVRVPVCLDVVAAANATDVEEAALHANGSTDRETSSPANWTTRQVGGDVIFRGGWVGDVVNSTMQKVGHADYSGVYTSAIAGGASQTPFPHAVGVFSTTADGLYGFDDGTALRNEGGVATFSSPQQKLVIRNGDEFLLRVCAQAGATAP